MHKKLEAELISLAHQILQMKNKHDAERLRDKAKDVYEKLSVLAFVNNYFITTPNVTGNKEAFIAKIDNNVIEIPNVVKETPKPEIKEKTQKEEVKNTKKEESKEESKEDAEEITKAEENNKLVKQTMQTIKSEAKEIVTKIQEQEVKPSSKEMDRQALIEKEKTKRKTLEEEMEGSIPADVAADLFEKVGASDVKEPAKPKEKLESKPVIKEQQKAEEPKETNKGTSLNDRLFKQKLQVGLNDRIAFVKHLFNFSQEDFNRVLSQLNTFETEQACKDFIENVVKPEYDWSEKLEYEERLNTLIERKFM